MDRIDVEQFAREFQDRVADTLSLRTGQKISRDAGSSTMVILGSLARVMAERMNTVIDSLNKCAAWNGGSEVEVGEMGYEQYLEYRPWLRLRRDDDRVAAVTAAMRGTPAVDLAAAVDAEPEPERRWPGQSDFRCTNPSCPPRAAVAAASAPTCYTCGCTMRCVS